MCLCQILEESFRPDTVLVSIMTVNNEIGVKQPIEEIGESLLTDTNSQQLQFTADTSFIQFIIIIPQIFAFSDGPSVSVIYLLSLIQLFLFFNILFYLLPSIMMKKASCVRISTSPT